jgi:hypothetical protein
MPDFRIILHDPDEDREIDVQARDWHHLLGKVQASLAAAERREARGGDPAWSGSKITLEEL